MQKDNQRLTAKEQAASQKQKRESTFASVDSIKRSHFPAKNAGDRKTS
jgi:hypothetical protein